MAAALLLRAMLEPSTPEGRRVRLGLQGLLECAVVKNTKSSTLQPHGSRAELARNQPPRRGRPRHVRPSPPIHREETRPSPCLSGSAPTSMLEQPLMLGAVIRTRPSLRDTNHGGREVQPRARHPGLRPPPPASSVRQFTGPSSLPGSASQPTSPNTQGRRILSFGSRITA